MTSGEKIKIFQQNFLFWKFYHVIFFFKQLPTRSKISVIVYYHCPKDTAVLHPLAPVREVLYCSNPIPWLLENVKKKYILKFFVIDPPFP